MKKITVLLLTGLLVTGLLTACGSNKGDKQETTIAGQETTTEASKDKTSVKVGSLKGPTSMGIVSLMDKQDKGETTNNYEFTMVTAADELLAKMISKDVDIALVPANMGSVLYNKTKGQVTVIDINTLGVLYVVTGDSSINTLADLEGKTLYLTGKGTTPDYVIQYLLKEDGLTDKVKLGYKSEPTEVAAILKENPDAVGLLPQPFATVACAGNDKLAIKIDLTKEWYSIVGEGGSKLVTGVTIVRNEFLEKNKDAVTAFMEEHKASVDFAATDVEKTAELVVKAGIIEKQPIAVKAIPYCSITYIDGVEMKQALDGYLKVLSSMDAKSIGGKLPADDFYLSSR